MVFEPPIATHSAAPTMTAVNKLITSTPVQNSANPFNIFSLIPLVIGLITIILYIFQGRRNKKEKEQDNKHKLADEIITFCTNRKWDIRPKSEELKSIENFAIKSEKYDKQIHQDLRKMAELWLKSRSYSNAFVSTSKDESDRFSKLIKERELLSSGIINTVKIW